MPTIGLSGAPTLPPLPAHVHAPSIPNYDVVAFIGQGGMGRVFKAIDRRLQRPGDHGKSGPADCTATVAEAAPEAELLLATDDTANVHELIGNANVARADCASARSKPSRPFLEVALAQYRVALKRAPAQTNLQQTIAALERRLNAPATP